MGKNTDIKALLAEMRDLARREDEASAAGDGTRKAETMDGRAAVAQQLSDKDTDKLGDEISRARKGSLDAQVEALTKLLADSRPRRIPMMKAPPAPMPPASVGVNRPP